MTEKRKRKCIVIVKTLFGRVQDIYTVGQMEKTKSKIAEYKKLGFHEGRNIVKELNTDKIVRIELPNDQGLVLKRTWNS